VPTPSPAYETIRVERRGGADWLTLDRPQRLNALSVQMVGELADYFEGLRASTEQRVVVMRGAGRAFCAGLDIKEARIDELRDPLEGLVFQRRFSGVVLAMRRCPQPVVALVHGSASGGGFSLAMAADVRIAAASARFNAAFIRVGFSGADMGSSYFLPRLVGLSNASELLMTGRFVDAARALRIGIVSEVVSEEGLEAAGQALVDDMLATSPLGLRVTKEALNANVDSPLEAAIALEDRHQMLCALGDDVAEGLAAFLEKRAPRFGTW
jgi:enoyl-CoA hydratase/carnithine racemase